MECRFRNTSPGDLVRQSGDLKRVEKGPGRISHKRVTYLLRRVNRITVSEPAAHRTKLCLVLKQKSLCDGVSHRNVPFNKLIALGKPFSVDVRVELDLMGTPVVGDYLDTKVREGDRLVH